MLTKKARKAKKAKLEKAKEEGYLYVQRIEKYTVSKNHPNFKPLDKICNHSRALGNSLNYICRNSWEKDHTIPSYVELNDLCTSGAEKHLSFHYYEMLAQPAQQTIIQIRTDWDSYFKAVKAYREDPSKFLGKPNPPGYKQKRALVVIPQRFMVTGDSLKFLSSKEVKLIKLFKKYPSDKIKQIRIVPQATCYKVEVVYEMKIKKVCEDDLKDKIRRIVGLDLGVNNFFACANNVGLKPFVINGRKIKSINQFYNKVKAKVQKSLPYYYDSDGKKKQGKWSSKLTKLTFNRSQVLLDLMHKISKFLVAYCVYHQIDTVIVGYNPSWKQKINIGKRNNQNFVCIPFRKFLDILEYKLLDAGILYKEVTEEYTSKCSFLDDEPLQHSKKYLGKRIKRGLFKSAKGILINADINAALNMIRKVFPNAFDLFKGRWDRGCGLHPVKLDGLFELAFKSKKSPNVPSLKLLRNLIVLTKLTKLQPE